MPQPLPCRAFHTLPELQIRWRATPYDLRRWLVGGHLKGHVFLPVMSVYKRAGLSSARADGVSRIPYHWEGFASVSRDYCHRLFRFGRVALREIACEASGELYSFPDSTADVIVTLCDLVVLEKERRRFESAYRIEEPRADGEHRSIIADAEFKIVRYKNREYRMGDMQAAILRRLHVSAQEGQPWQSGKRLLQDVGSQSFSLSNVFKRNLVWRELVLSDGRGGYRLKPGSVKIDGA